MRVVFEATLRLCLLCDNFFFLVGGWVGGGGLTLKEREQGLSTERVSLCILFHLVRVFGADLRVDRLSSEG